MSTYLSPQPTRPFTTPLTIPRPPNYNYHAYHPSLPYNPYTHRSNTPPSLSPSPAPSAASSTAATTTSMIEIEELPTDTDTDSAIATAAPFEFEEAPENYRRGRTLVYGSDDEEEDGGDDDDEDLLAASHKSILYGFERLTARGSGGGAGKRSYAESVGSVSSGGSWGDSGIEGRVCLLRVYIFFIFLFSFL
ncbi:hypothetical protein P167DRAFT_12745 [Morchella conica CCBAS932]|uniref:Uncharacterized protein n=1 Tax=Morchella conica CCBAS932 TaxID=1392247 RepID=A0A3N4LAX2_9PEZI|nr:hypothetical protein P167DRAFT_12745 [Morchella conica CCBAS932]